jgi:hypothetical protein
MMLRDGALGVRNTNAQDWFAKYWRWATSEVDAARAPWPEPRGLPYPASVLTLKLQDLCSPIFPVDPEPPKRTWDERLNHIWDRYSRLGDPPSAKDVDSLLDEISRSEVLSLFPEFDLTYVAQALALARVSRFADAEDVLESAFRKCPVKSALCKALADTKLWYPQAVAFGWYMQSCLLGYESYLPYLQLSEAATAVGMVELGNRLLNASDIVGESMRRLSPAAVTRSLAQGVADRLRLAFEEFLQFADCFLPPADVLPPPDDQHEREVWFSILKMNPEGKPTPRSRVLGRAFARKGSVG